MPVGVVLPHEPDAPVAEVADTCTHRARQLADYKDFQRRGRKGASRRSWVGTVEEHDGPGVGGLEELGVRGRLDGPASGSSRHLQPRPPRASCGLRLLPQVAVPSVELELQGR